MEYIYCEALINIGWYEVVSQIQIKISDCLNQSYSYLNMVEYIKSRSGHALNLNLLSPGELKVIKAGRVITPQEFVKSDGDDFIFLVRNPDSGKRAEARVSKNALFGALQGLYMAADNRLIVLRSLVEDYLQKSNASISIRAFTAELKDVRVIEKIAPDASFIALPNYDRSSAELYHRWVDPTLRKLGIGSEMIYRLEKSCSAMGLSQMRVCDVFENGRPTQQDVFEQLSKRGYVISGSGDRQDLTKKLQTASPDDNMATHHKFPLNASRPRIYYSEPLRPQ